MKIRSDYVSNSSSSSFMIVGSVFTDERISEIGEKLGLVDCDTFDDCSTWDIIDKIANKYDIRFERGLENYYGEWCLGLHYSDMKDSETKKEFENRIAEKLKDLTGEKCDVGELVDGGRDG